MRTVPATEFKAKCLKLMDRVAERRERYVITKRGRPVAELVPAEPPRQGDIFGCMADRTAFVGDLERPVWTQAEWNAFERRRAVRARDWERERRSDGTVSGKKPVRQPARSDTARSPRGRGRRRPKR
jgi:prevent-host-death family protein